VIAVEDSKPQAVEMKVEEISLVTTILKNA